ncbi:MAG: DUF642 domain-containing protein [Sedimentitalea sp.]
MTAAVVAAATTLAGAAGAATIVNGSFEDKAVAANTFRTYDTSFNEMTGWTIEAGSVDVAAENFWEASDGVQSVDLIGNTGLTSPTVISQTITGLVIGQEYNISFDLAGSPGNVYTMTASMGMTAQTYDFDATMTSFANMGYVTEVLNFVAGDVTGLLSFSARVTNCCKGPVLDNVRIAPVTVAAVPLPAGGVLLAGALGGIMIARRRRKA